MMQEINELIEEYEELMRSFENNAENYKWLAKQRIDENRLINSIFFLKAYTKEKCRLETLKMVVQDLKELKKK